MAEFPKYFPEKVGPMPTYDYQDLLSGEGIISFEGFKSVDSTGTSYHLSSNSLGSCEGTLTTNYALETVNGTTTVFTYNFNSLPFKIPRYVKGTSLVSAYITNTAIDGTKTATSYVVATLQHVDGSTSTVTDIGTKTSASLVNSTATDYTQKNILIISLTETLFKTNDYLRLKIEMSCAAPNAGIRYFSLNLGLNDEFLLLNLPFRIDQ